MKIRRGFVSNSSSSSFIVVLNRKPQSVDELRKVMFPYSDKDDLFTGDCDYYSPRTIADIVAQVFCDITAKGRATNKRLLEEFHSYCYEYVYDDSSSKEFYKQEREFKRLYGQEFMDILSYLDRDISWIKADEKKKLRKLFDLCLTSKKDRLLHVGHEKECIRSVCSFMLKNENYSITSKQISDVLQTKKEYQKRSWQKLRQEQKDTNEKAKKMLEEFKAKHKGRFIVVLEYGDDGGQGLMEHGGIFNNVDHIRVSHH